jgi:hypothetical protein
LKTSNDARLSSKISAPNNKPLTCGQYRDKLLEGGAGESTSGGAAGFGSPRKRVFRPGLMLAWGAFSIAAGGSFELPAAGVPWSKDLKPLPKTNLLTG